jgi:regulator of protease activity HflC (stomatin/prohibitin superfamily)
VHVFGVRFIKTAPTTYVLHFSDGKIRREGPGLSFFYYSPTSTIVAVPMASSDVLFVFNEATADFQSITIQGQLTYRVVEPKRLAEVLDFSIEPNGKFRAEDPERLRQRLVHEAQVRTHTVTQRMPLREALVSVDVIMNEVMAALRTSESVIMMGVEVLGLSILSVKPTPEMAKALEAEAREELQRRSDEAIYARRNAAVEQERRIKESELNTEIAVEEKKRQIRETQMNADIAVEQQRAALLERRLDNDRKQADAKAYALETTLKPLRDADWKWLMAVNGQANARVLTAMAFQQLADNADKIGQLNITPDLLNSLLADGS